jgi:hypothetical protein
LNQQRGRGRLWLKCIKARYGLRRAAGCESKAANNQGKCQIELHVHIPVPGDARRLDGRHHPSCDPSAAEDTDYESSCAHYDARGPDHQQFGPPQANRTGSFFTETIIAAPLAVARPSDTMMGVVIFTIFLPTGERCSKNAVSRLFGGTPLRGSFYFRSLWRADNRWLHP